MDSRLSAETCVWFYLSELSEISSIRLKFPEYSRVPFVVVDLAAIFESTSIFKFWIAIRLRP
jgi:hypothetical protein